MIGKLINLFVIWGGRFAGSFFILKGLSGLISGKIESIVIPGWQFTQQPVLYKSSIDILIASLLCIVIGGIAIYSTKSVIGTPSVQKTKRKR